MWGATARLDGADQDRAIELAATARAAFRANDDTWYETRARLVMARARPRQGRTRTPAEHRGRARSPRCSTTSGRTRRRSRSSWPRGSAAAADEVRAAPPRRDVPQPAHRPGAGQRMARARPAARAGRRPRRRAARVRPRPGRAGRPPAAAGQHRAACAGDRPRRGARRAGPAARRRPSPAHLLRWSERWRSTALAQTPVTPGDRAGPRVAVRPAGRDPAAHPGPGRGRADRGPGDGAGPARAPRARRAPPAGGRRRGGRALRRRPPGPAGRRRDPGRARRRRRGPARPGRPRRPGTPPRRRHDHGRAGADRVGAVPAAPQRPRAALRAGGPRCPARAGAARRRGPAAAGGSGRRGADRAAARGPVGAAAGARGPGLRGGPVGGAVAPGLRRPAGEERPASCSWPDPAWAPAAPRCRCWPADARTPSTSPAPTRRSRPHWARSTAPGWRTSPRTAGSGPTARCSPRSSWPTVR